MNEGSSVVLMCKAVASINGLVSYQWAFRHDDLSNFTDVDESSSLLFIDDISPQQGGQYMCSVRTGINSGHEVVNVVVSPAGRCLGHFLKN